MLKSIGQTIKSLRRERNLTQEELAELLAVSPQAVSKWENETSMPDISLLVPLARVFVVSTDLLLGLTDEASGSEIDGLIESASREKSSYSGYLKLLDGLRRHPGEPKLLMAALEHSIALGWPENDCYDSEHAGEICERAERLMKLVVSYAHNASDILRARMIVVMLNASRGRLDKAREQLPHFPTRADLTYNSVAAFIAEAAGETEAAVAHRRWELLYLTESTLDCIANASRDMLALGEAESAEALLTVAVELMDSLARYEPSRNLNPRRDCGDIRELLAEAQSVRSPR